MAFICGADLPNRGTSLNLLWVNTSVNCQLISSAWSDSVSARPLPSLFFRGLDALVVFPLAICIRVEASGVCLYVSNQVIHIQIVLLFNLSFNFSFQFLKPSFQPSIASFLCFRTSSVSFSNRPPYPRCVPRNWAYRSASFWRNMLVCSFLNKRSYQINFFWTEGELRWPLKYFSFANFKASFLIELWSPQGWSEDLFICTYRWAFMCLQYVNLAT